MGKRVRVKTLVAMAGPFESYAAGDIMEFEEEAAAVRISLGLAEAIDEPAVRRAVNRAGQPLETAAVTAPEQRQSPDQVSDAMLALLDGVPSDTVGALIQAGYDSVDGLAAATNDELEAVDGVGPATVKKIRAAVEAWHAG